MILSMSFSVIIAAFTALISIYSTAAAPTRSELDACGSLSSKSKSTDTLTYQDVAFCYTSIPYNATIANTTLDTITTLFKDYYVFRDAALTSDLKAPFTSPSVDILKELDALRRKEFRSDFEFHSTVSRVVDSLHDAHASYYVETIDDHPALEYLLTWSDRLASSKDAGVRLNRALASQIYDQNDRAYVMSAGDFAERYSLPETPSIAYKLRCRNKSKSKTWTAAEVEGGEEEDKEKFEHVIVPWRAIPLLDVKDVVFDSAAGYIANVCTKPDYYMSTSTSTTGNDDALKKRALNQRPPPKTLQPSKSILLSEHDELQQIGEKNSSPPAADSRIPLKYPDARLVAAGEASTVYYQLKDKPHVGVVVVMSHEASNKELETARQAFKTFHDNGVTHLIIDFQSNGGGRVDFALTFVQLLFPSSSIDDSNNDGTKPQTPYFPSDLRVTKPIRELSSAIALADFATSAGLYGPHIYLDLSTNKPYTTNSLFVSPRTITRNNRNATYSHLTTLIPPRLPTDAQLLTYKWTGNPKNMILLSNGYCGSACAMSSSLLNSVYSVPALTIGGLHKKDISFFTFPGGAVSSLDQFSGVFLRNGMSPPFEDLPYVGGVSFPLLEIYRPTIPQPPPENEEQAPGAENCNCYGSDDDDDDDSNIDDNATSVPSIPLEYDPEAHRTDLHLDWDNINSRKRDVLWSQVASAASWP
ncbi:hypothetical protein BG015_011633 [Linnemannia schmuckeri]|uniref:Tail specific protease domain-containing protein n=1 Tax=Linnemannia schmuckeri TaxID=64567 RepID=A0A9P5V821_9FUNG|nr:hypothetical protein BG015_011633 [Linnemannia schmuckeri]